MIKHELLRLLHLGRASADRPGRFCIDEAGIVAYAEKRLDPVSRRRVERHLARCPYCVGQLAFALRAESLEAPSEDVDRFIELVARRRSRGGAARAASLPRWAFPVATAAAALLVAAIAIWWYQMPGLTDRSEAPTIRNGLSESPAPAVVAPVEGEVVSPERLEIRWTPVPEALSYRVQLVTAAGDLLWEGKIEATASRPPPSVGLQPGETYYVWIEAQLRGGGSVSSPVVGFRAADR